MRIFYAAATTLDSSIPSSRLWYDHLYLPLVDLGYEMVQFDCDLSPHFRYPDISLPSERFFAEKNPQSRSRHFLSNQAGNVGQTVPCYEKFQGSIMSHILV